MSKAKLVKGLKGVVAALDAALDEQQRAANGQFGSGGGSSSGSSKSSTSSTPYEGNKSKPRGQEFSGGWQEAPGSNDNEKYKNYHEGISAHFTKQSAAAEKAGRSDLAAHFKSSAKQHARFAKKGKQ